MRSFCLLRSSQHVVPSRTFHRPVISLAPEPLMGWLLSCDAPIARDPGPSKLHLSTFGQNFLQTILYSGSFALRSQLFPGDMQVSLFFVLE